MSKKILVIDDEELIIKSLKKLLEKNGFTVFVAKSGQDALVMTEEEDFDLIVADIRMPQLDGIETIKKIRQLLKERKKKLAPEILITGYADENSYKNALELKVADYIYKPFDMRDLLEAIKKNLK